LITQQPVQTFRSTKFVVRVAFSPCGQWLATASYDKHIVIYRLTTDDEPEEVLDDTDEPYLACEPGVRYTEYRRIKVDYNPEALLFNPNSQWLMYTTRSSHQLYYVPLGGATDPVRTKSFNHHAYDTHVSFSVLNMALHPSGKIIACQTGDHAGNAGERILLYGVDVEDVSLSSARGLMSDRATRVYLDRIRYRRLRNSAYELVTRWDGSNVSMQVELHADGRTTSPNGLLHLLSISGEIRTSLRVHGLSVEAVGAATSGIIRDCAVVDLGDSEWEVVSVGYDRVVRISR
jgi:hypothetical protein